MSLTTNRRSFLLSLIALGASYALPKNASAAQVDKVWEQALDTPWSFAVNEWRTITDPDYTEAQTWDEVFDFICVNSIRRWQDVVDTVDRCQPLASYFVNLANKELENLKALDESELNARSRRLLAALEADPDEGWLHWVEIEGAKGVNRFKEEIASWLQEPADYSQSEWFPRDHGPQGQAKAFFESLDWDTLDALGVVIIEGEHPGSSYYAAELRRPFDEANAAAQELGLPFRFRAE